MKAELWRSSCTFAALLSAAACGNTKAAPDDAGVEDTSSPPTDVAGGEGDGALDAPVGCFALTGSGSAQTCSFRTDPSSGASCASFAGSASGSCPSSGLDGCCILSNDSDGGFRDFTATCYYATGAAETAQGECENQAYMGVNAAWALTLP